MDRSKRGSRRCRWLPVALAMALGLVLAGCGGRESSGPSGASSSQGTAGGAPAASQGTSGKIVTLKVADSFPTTHWGSVKLAQPWMKRVEELSKGKVKFEYYPAEQLGKLNDLMNLAATRVADIAYVLPTQFPGDLPMSNVSALPGGYSSSVAGQRAYDALMRQGPVLDEYLKKGMRPLLVVPVPPYEIFGVKKAIRLPGDVRGLKVRTAGGTQSLIAETLGGAAVSVPTPDLYTALQRGTVDATFFYQTGLKDYKLDELVKNGTYGAAITGAPVVYAINEEVWKGLDPEVRKAMEQASAEIPPQVAKYLDDETESRVREYEGKGIQIFRLNDQERAAWLQALAPVRDRWIQEMEAKGLPARQVVEAWDKAVRP